MNGLVLDASVTAAWCFEDEETAYARDVLSRSQDISFLPSSYSTEAFMFQRYPSEPMLVDAFQTAIAGTSSNDALLAKRFYESLTVLRSF